VEILTNIVWYLLFVLFAALVTLWRRADDWDGIPFPQRFVLAISRSRGWWVAYSIGYLAYWMGRLGGSFRTGFPVVVVAAAMAAFLSLIRLPR
jgi:hypothetical protein